jgi:hypothetical protein
MLSVIVAAIGALVAVAIGLPSMGVVLAAAGAFVVAVVLMGLWGSRSFRGRGDTSLEPHFPSPKT